MTKDKKLNDNSNKSRETSHGGESGPTPRLGLATGVTREIYPERGKAFIGAYAGAQAEGIPFLIAIETGTREGTQFAPTVREWGAWLAYFERKKINHVAMAHRPYYTVPARWPHLFDAEASIAADMESANAFEQHQRRSRKTDTAEPGRDRKAFVTGELGYDPEKARSSRACFVAPAPNVDVSDFPASTSRAFDPSPDAKPAPENPPWRDKDELARSMERINQRIAGKDYLFGEGDTPPKEPAP
jgi:hypothetical protein